VALDQVSNGPQAWRVHQFHNLGRIVGGRLFLYGFSQVDIGRIVTLVGKCDGVLSGVRQHVKLVGCVSPDASRISSHGAIAQAQTIENRAVSVIHHVVGFLERSLAGVEGVGVLHDEFATAHDAEPRADFVAEFCLDLVQVLGKLAITPHLILEQGGNDLLMGRSQAETAVVAIGEAQELGSILLPPAGFLPQFRGLDPRQQDLLGTGSVHFLTYDILDLKQYPHARRQPVVDSCSDTPDQPGSKHQLVGNNFGIRRGFFQRGKKLS